MCELPQRGTLELSEDAGREEHADRSSDRDELDESRRRPGIEEYPQREGRSADREREHHPAQFERRVIKLLSAPVLQGCQDRERSQGRDRRTYLPGGRDQREAESTFTTSASVV